MRLHLSLLIGSVILLAGFIFPIVIWLWWFAAGVILGFAVGTLYRRR